MHYSPRYLQFRPCDVVSTRTRVLRAKPPSRGSVRAACRDDPLLAISKVLGFVIVRKWFDRIV